MFVLLQMYRTQIVKSGLGQTIFRMSTVSSAKQARELTIKDMPQPISLPLIGTKLALFAAGGGSRCALL